MNKKDLQERIIKDGGFILSHDADNAILLAKVYDLLNEYTLTSSWLQNAIITCYEFDYEFNANTHPLEYYVYRGWATLKKSAIEYPFHASFLFNKEISNFFNNISPNGYYFGFSKENRTMIGWFEDS